MAADIPKHSRAVTRCLIEALQGIGVREDRQQPASLPATTLQPLPFWKTGRCGAYAFHQLVEIVARGKGEFEQGRACAFNAWQ